MTSRVVISRVTTRLSLAMGLAILITSCATTTPAQLSYWSDTDVCKLAGASPWFYAQGDIDNAQHEATRRKLNCAGVINTYQSSGAYAADMKQRLNEVQTHMLFMQKLKQPPPSQHSECYNFGSGVRCEYYNNNSNSSATSFFDCHPSGDGYRCQ
jgi:hypothetical protein